MSVSQLNAFNNISASTPVVLLSYISAGSDRWLYIVVGMRNGAGNAKQPTSLSIGGVAATYICGGDTSVATDRVSVGVWGINEAGIADLTLNGGATGYDVTMSGQSGTVRTVLTFSVQGAHQSAPTNTNNIFTATSASATSLSLTRTENSYTVFIAYCNTVTTLTLAEPSRDTTFTDSGNGTQFNIGYEADSARTVNSTYSALANRVSAVVFNIAEAVALPGIVSIDGDVTPEQPDEAQDLDVVTANLGTVTSGNLGGRAVTINSAGANSCNIDFPARVDGMTWPSLPETITLTLTDGTNSPTIGVDITLRDDEAKVVFADVDSTTQTGLGYHLAQAGYPLSDDDEGYYPSLTVELVINPDSSVDINALQTVLLWIRRNSDGVWNSFNVTFENNAVVSVDRSVKKLTSSNITAKKITAKKISSKKF